MTPKLTKQLMSAWVLMQVPRVIALPLIASVLAGRDPAAWLFPALIDIVLAAGVPVALLCLWRGRSLVAWTYLVAWLVISIFDHASAATAFYVAGTPSIFKDYGAPGVAVPLVQ